MNNRQQKGQRRTKRIFDLGLSVLSILILSPLLVLLALIIFVSMGRPVLFKQRRPGLNEIPFYLYKFRTMTESKDSKGTMLPDEQRMTAIGTILRRYSIDELPQLFNVAKGDLSFVGPRPLLMEYIPLYTPEQARRHDVKPGITGWAQVNGRNAITWEERFKLDVWYVDYNNFRLDMKILLRTIYKVVKGEGISAESCVTMPKFTGSRVNGRKA